MSQTDLEQPIDPQDDLSGDAPPGGTAEELMYEAEAGRRRAVASMSLVHKEHFGLLFANCFFFAGSLAAWTRVPPGTTATSASLIHGLDTIRGTTIFALALYGFWVSAVGLYTKRTVIWPFLLNAILALWVGLGGVIGGISGFDKAIEEVKKRESYSALDTALAGPGSIAPGAWMLAVSGLLVMFMILKGILGGASKAKAAKAEAAAARRR
jgi:uncharacterized membrane protein